MLLDDVLNYASSNERQKYLKYKQLLEQHDKFQLELKGYPEFKFSGMITEVVTKKQELDKLLSRKESLENQYQDLLKKLSVAGTALKFSEKAYEFWKEVLYRTNQFYLNDLSSMLTDCYRTIYQSTDTTIQLVSEEFRNRQIIKIKFLVNINGVQFAEEFSSQAGSIKTILGLVMSIYYIILMDLPRVIFIDETLASLDVDVLHRTLDVLKKFTNKFGFCYLCITHHGKYLLDYIDKAYSINDDGEYFEISPEETK